MKTLSKTSHFLSVCSANFKRLEKVIDLKTLNDVEILLNRDSSKAKFKIIQKSNHTLILDALYVSPNEILEFSFRLHFYIDAEMVEVISYQNEKPVPFFIKRPMSQSVDEKFQQNRLLTEWLEYIFENGMSPKKYFV